MMVLGRFALLIAALTLIIIGTTFSFADPRPCAINFREEGSLLSGKKFTTFQVSPSESKDALHPALVRALVAQGYEIAGTDKDGGSIRALNPGRPGRRASMDAAITQLGESALRVELTFTLLAGIMAASDRVRDEFCGLLTEAFAAVAESSTASPRGRGTSQVVAQPERTASSSGAVAQAQSPFIRFTKGGSLGVGCEEANWMLGGVARVAVGVPPGTPAHEDGTAHQFLEQGKDYALANCPSVRQAAARTLYPSQIAVYLYYEGTPPEEAEYGRNVPYAAHAFYKVYPDRILLAEYKNFAEEIKQTEARLESIRQRLNAFRARNKVQQFVSCSSLKTNPYALERKVVGTVGQFDSMIAADTAIIARGSCRVVVSGIPRGTFTTKRVEILLAGEVVGQAEVRGLQLPQLRFVGIHICQEEWCRDVLPRPIEYLEGGRLDF